MALFLYLLAGVAVLAAARCIHSISWRASVILLALPLVLTGRALLTAAVFAPLDLTYMTEPLASVAGKAGVTHVMNPALSDVIAQFIPWKAAVRFALAHHEWPLWNPFELCGDPLAGSTQIALFHPVTVIGHILPLAQFLTFEAAMTLLLGAVSMFLFIREVLPPGRLRDGDPGTSEWTCEIPALFGAAAWAFSTNLVSFLGTAHSAATAILPFVLLGARRIARSPGLRSASLLTAALLLEILCGHPETLLHTVSLAIVYFLFELLLHRKRSQATRDALAAPGHKVLLAGFGAGTVSLLLGAVVLLPLFEALPQTYEYRFRLAIGARPMSESISQTVHRLRVNVIPFLEGEQNGEDILHDESRDESSSRGWFTTSYAGAVALPLMVFALTASRDPRKWFFLALFVWGILCGAEAHGVTSLLQHLPGFSIAVNARMISFAVLAVSVLAAMGLDEAMRGRARALSWLSIGLAALIVPAAMMLHANLSTNFIRINTVREVLPLVLAAIAALAFRAPRAFGMALLFLLVMQRVTELGRTYPTYPQRAFYPDWPGLRSMPRGGEPYRVVGLGNMLTPNMATNYELEDARGYQAMTFAPLVETFPLWSVPVPVWSNRVDDLRSPFLSLMNVRFAIVPPRTAVPAGWRVFGAYPDYWLLENPRTLPRAFVPGMIHRDSLNPLSAMSHCKDFAREGWINIGAAPIDLSNGRGNVSTRPDGTRLLIHASMVDEGWVIVSEAAWKGWNAFEGEHRVHLETADHAFLAFHLGRGEHDVLLTYRPHSFVVGGAISGVTAMALAVGLLFVRARREPKS